MCASGWDENNKHEGYSLRESFVCDCALPTGVVLKLTDTFTSKSTVLRGRWP